MSRLVGIFVLILSDTHPGLSTLTSLPCPHLAMRPHSQLTNDIILLWELLGAEISLVGSKVIHICYYYWVGVVPVI